MKMLQARTRYSPLEGVQHHGNIPTRYRLLVLLLLLALAFSLLLPAAGFGQHRGGLGRAPGAGTCSPLSN
jgi:hypothetical protein